MLITRKRVQTSSAGFRAVGPLLQCPFVEDAVLMQQVGLKRGPETILDDVLVRHSHL